VLNERERALRVRRLEIRPSVSGLERGPGVIPSLRSRAGSKRSEGSGSPDAEILRCAQDDRYSLQMSAQGKKLQTFFVLCDTMCINLIES